MKKIVLLTLLVASLFAQVDLKTAKLYKADINSTKAYEMQNKGVILVDVRTKGEFKYGHPKDSINVPVFFEQYGQRVFNKNFLNEIYSVAKGDLNKELILICRSGARTKIASNLLAQNGFKNVYNITNGFSNDWSKVNLPIEK